MKIIHKIAIAAQVAAASFGIASLFSGSIKSAASSLVDTAINFPKNSATAVANALVFTFKTTKEIVYNYTIYPLKVVLGFGTQITDDLTHGTLKSHYDYNPTEKSNNKPYYGVHTNEEWLEILGANGPQNHHG